jgi:hypothetical protein
VRTLNEDLGESIRVTANRNYARAFGACVRKPRCNARLSFPHEHVVNAKYVCWQFLPEAQTPELQLGSLFPTAQLQSSQIPQRSHNVDAIDPKLAARSSALAEAQGRIDHFAARSLPDADRGRAGAMPRFDGRFFLVPITTAATPLIGSSSAK